MNREAMLAPFAEEEIRQFQGRGGQTMTYIEDETVMDRLDAGFGPGNWSVLVDPVSESVVKVRLGVRDGETWTWYEDFGYPNREGGETLKEAVSDGIRRCGRFVGIARDLYRKSTYEAGGSRGPQRPQNGPQRPVAAPAPQRPPAQARPRLVDTSVPQEPEGLGELFEHPTVRADFVECPIHQIKWNGSPGDLWHRDPAGGICRHPDNERKVRAR